ncbi:uncharacterized protein LOC134224388 [Armigeres subalbatus]|uniref:uncharacterized protein LOC134224388 n=1 Tax=Armigeres subalbatus TaxID=124917 RepID=UPI002ECFE08D
MVEVWKFRTRTQKEGESVKEFVTELQRNAKFCKFDDYLSKELRNQLVFGLRSKRIRSRLIEEKHLTFEKALEISLSMEASGEGAEIFEKRLQEVNYTDNRSSQDFLMLRGFHDQKYERKKTFESRILCNSLQSN